MPAESGKRFSTVCIRAKEGADTSGGQGGFNLIATLLGAIATILLAFNTWKVSQFETELRAAESVRELNFRIYASIAEAIESNNPQRIRAVCALVEALSSST